MHRASHMPMHLVLATETSFAAGVGASCSLTSELARSTVYGMNE